MNKTVFDIITTLLLAMIPLILFFQNLIVTYTPPEFLILATLILAVLSQYAADQRVQQAVETVTAWKYFDIFTTILFAVAPILLAYQSIILQQIPITYVPIAVFLFGALSQVITEFRVKAATPLEQVTVELIEN